MRLFLALCLMLELTPYQCDVNTAYLNDCSLDQGDSRFSLSPKNGVEGETCAVWFTPVRSRNDLITNSLEDKGFNQCTPDPCQDMYRKGGVVALLLLYVDDVILASNTKAFKVRMFRKLDGAFVIKDQCVLPGFLGLQIDINESVSRRFVAKATGKHCGAINRTIRFLAASKDHGIFFDRKEAGNMTKKLVIDGSFGGGPISWSAYRQSVVARSTAEAKYVAFCKTCMDGRGLAYVLMEVLPNGIHVRCNRGVHSQSALALAASPAYSRKTRHIELRYHFVRDLLPRFAVESGRSRQSC
ncbi:LOW QUALITY PROTEIN: hypothetical protein PHMEG_00012137 [Phytophthora megakarya]|uniref:Reverse transcriptase Ty1/copia-type domain-containing protein n=1 Tax=Phytophthora megakarya TaxID=4795 RepID=A0A225W9H6_9STRA|nr:LOW QUALITY PROTEIN: hypothetical protein PHMEG_00012137 [Phytophthora megakarya]